MAGDWKVRIGEGAQEFTIDANARFDMASTVAYSESGVAQSVETNIEIVGDIADLSFNEGKVADELVLVRDQVVSSVNLGPRRVRLDQDGVNKFDFLPSTHIGSPVITLFRTIEEDGNGQSHWRFGLTIFIKRAGNEKDNLIDLVTSILTVKDNGKLIRKVWRATAKARTLNDALVAVLRFKPADKFIVEELDRQFQGLTVVAVWTWEARQGSNLIAIEEDPIEVRDEDDDYVVSKQVGDPNRPPVPAILHRARNRAAVVTIKGTVRGFDKNLKRPQPHFAEGPNARRWRAAEQRWFVQLEDVFTGKYRLPFMEVWLFTGPIPNPNHIAHGVVPKVQAAPGDGRIAVC